ncbi:hypothetical protein [Marinilabilia sp.]|uniref:tetratricopeptide repeat protein n=1 Tax=Marinilabilia sp. TaxID=2021252 RepID=UPI0025C28D96|nr:hypothetical protein [Marinilabilia sp.]
MTNAQVEKSVYWNNADSLLTARNYTGSLVELERIVFTTSDQKVRQKAIFRKAMVHKSTGRYEEVQAELTRIGVIRNPKDSLFTLKAYELALAQYMTEDYQSALNTIENCTIMLPEKHQAIQSLLTLKALCHNQIFQFDEAEKTLVELQKHVPEEQSALYTKAIGRYDDTPKYKDPEKARHLSLLPGLGQVYTGKVFEGGVSFLLNASALSFGAWQVYSGYYFTGYVVGVTLLQKFHSGGQHRAELLAIEKNRKNILEFNTEITNALLNVNEK